MNSKSILLIVMTFSTFGYAMATNQFEYSPNEIQSFQKLEYKPTYFILNGEKGEIVRISLEDGTVTLSKKGKDREAAERFWQAVENSLGERIKKCKTDQPDEQQ